MNRSIYTVAVFAGSSQALLPLYGERVRNLGRELGRSYQTIFGGCNTGLMRELGLGVTESKGLITSVYPVSFASCADRFEAATHNVPTRDVDEQRAYMHRNAQAYLALPGGGNTRSEIWSAFTKNDTAAIAHRTEYLRPIIICNLDGSFDGLETDIQTQIAEGGMTARQASLFHFVTTVGDAIDKLHVLAVRKPCMAGHLRPQAQAPV